MHITDDSREKLAMTMSRLSTSCLPAQSALSAPRLYDFRGLFVRVCECVRACICRYMKCQYEFLWTVIANLITGCVILFDRILLVSGIM